MSDEAFAVLTVCTGNIGRSPMMERLLRHHASAAPLDAPLQVASAGTWGLEGEPMEPEAAQALRERGVDAAGFTARRLHEPLIAAADLVLTATREHRSAVVQLVPGAVRRTFTLLELARVLDRLPPRSPAHHTPPLDRMRDAVAWAAQNRSHAGGALGADDLEDPLGAPLEVYRERAQQIDAAVPRVLTLLRGTPSG